MGKKVGTVQTPGEDGFNLALIWLAEKLGVPVLFLMLMDAPFAQEYSLQGL